MEDHINSLKEFLSSEARKKEICGFQYLLSSCTLKLIFTCNHSAGNRPDYVALVARQKNHDADLIL